MQDPIPQVENGFGIILKGYDLTSAEAEAIVRELASQFPGIKTSADENFMQPGSIHLVAEFSAQIADSQVLEVTSRLIYAVWAHTPHSAQVRVLINGYLLDDPDPRKPMFQPPILTSESQFRTFKDFQARGEEPPIWEHLA